MAKGDPQAIKLHYRRSDTNRRPVCGARSTNMTFSTTDTMQVDCQRCIVWLMSREADTKAAQRQLR
jgi:hypothetical protein